MDLSVLIPARNEMFLKATIDNVLAHMEADSEIIVVLDGAWAEPCIPDHERVHLVYHSKSIGQRAATNEAARLARGQYVLKLDAHCAVDQGFDRKLIADYQPGETVIPRMYNLHVFDWLCQSCGYRVYQGPQPEKCEKCGAPGMVMDVVFQPRWNRKTDFARFDNTLHFQYWREYSNRPQSKGDHCDVMCCVGAGWMMSKARYFEIEGMDEGHGSWGQMGVELACKSHLDGGRQVVNKNTWFSHLFRTQPGFGFPYPNPGIDKARDYSNWLWRGNHWKKAIHPLSWLLEKYWPVEGWTEADLDAQKKLERGAL